MGYNLYLVKARNRFDEPNRFTETEWNAICAKHEVADWLSFDGDEIAVKNPSQEQITALVRVAKTCGWTVQGDDGETYADDGSADSLFHCRRDRAFLASFDIYSGDIAARRRFRNPCRQSLVPSRLEIKFAPPIEPAVS